MALKHNQCGDEGGSSSSTGSHFTLRTHPCSCKFHSGGSSETTPLLFMFLDWAEFMVPKIVKAFIKDSHSDEDLMYDERCDLWSLGVMVSNLLCVYTPVRGDMEDSVMMDLKVGTLEVKVWSFFF